MFEQKFPSTSDQSDPQQSGAAIEVRAACERSDLAARVQSLGKAISELPPPERIAYLRREIDGPLVFTHGFGIEGQLIFHWLCERDIDIDVVTFDTGRLFAETYTLWAETERRYGRRIRAVYPDQVALSSLVAKQGIDGFYESKQARLACCGVRKTRPLDHALAGASVWITALRGDQTATRRDAGLISFDAGRGLIKFNPLFDWTRAAVLAAVYADNIPINALHDKGFASIGCAPCTRAIKAGEPERNGRWWWENNGASEYALHLPKDSRKPRTNARPRPEGASAGCG
jgi:phosphoadenosine phosphosulfate reductase